MTQPTVGRVVHFYTKEGKYDFGYCFGTGRPHAAIVTHVHSDKLVNVVAFDANGKSHGFTSVQLVQADEQVYGPVYCEWMPFQKGQAQKAEELEKALAAK
jgi:hypothetical protein